MSADVWVSIITAYLLAEAAAGRPETTRKLRRQQLTRFAREIGCAPADLTADRLVTWVGNQTEWAIETRRSYRNTLNSFTSWAHTAGVIERPLHGVLPKVRPNVATPRPAPDDVWALALSRADDRTRLMLRLAGEAGLRRAEVAQVHRRDLLPGPSLLVHGKGSKDRVVPLSASLAAEIRAADGWLFPSGDGHLHPKSVGNIMAQLLPEGWSMHTLRHRFATRAYRGSRNLRAVQVLLGHTSIATTERYLAVDDDEVRAAMLSASYES